MNKAIIIGNLGADPDTRQTASGDAVANLSVATTEKWKDKQGNRQEKTEWHRVVVFGRLAEIAGQYLKKGAKVAIVGSIETRKWQDDQGQNRYSTEIKARELEMLDSRSDGRNQPQQPQQSSGGGFQDDVPF